MNDRLEQNKKAVTPISHYGQRTSRMIRPFALIVTSFYSSLEIGHAFRATLERKPIFLQQVVGVEAKTAA